MKFKSSVVCLLILAGVFVGCHGSAEHGHDHDHDHDHATETSSDHVAEPEPTPDDKVAELERMCKEARPAIEARQAGASLFQRVGGREGLHAVVVDTVRRHGENEQIKHLLEGVDTEHLVSQVTDFLVVGTGGEGEYQGRDMVQAHAHMNLTNADFLAAGGDLGAAMESAGWGEDESQELTCAFVNLREQVVTR